MLKNLHAFVLILFLSALFSQKTFAQFPYVESFTNATAAGVNLGGNALLTSGNADPAGNGYLRLTSNLNSQSGYAFISNSFPSTNGISTTFEYDTWGGTGADGICFFLFDAAVADNSFVIGSFGGSLGYSAGTTSPNGLSKGYLGVGLDEFGNFSHPAFGAGGTGNVPNSVTLRGAWDDSRGAFYMLKTVPVATNYGFAIGSGTSRAASGTPGFRKAFISLVPDVSGVGFDITVKIQHDAVSAPVTVIDRYYYNKPSPANLKFGFAASTGGSNNYHEIRNAGVTVPATPSMQTITFAALPPKTYGDADFDAGATASSNLAVTYASSDPTVATIVNNKVHIVGAGTTTITASQGGDENFYSAADVAQTLTVNKASLTITATDQSKTYGTVNPPLTAVYTGFVNGETSASLTTQPTFTTTATTTSQVGSYPITVSGAASPNYQITYVNGALSIYPGIQTITFTAAPKTYGDPDFTVSATASSGLPVTYSSSNTAIATVDNDGTVHIVKAGNVVISAIQTGNGNYVATTRINQQITINKAPLFIFADAKAKSYGDANPPLTLSYDGFVYGETIADLTTQPAVNTTATDASPAGNYPITVTGATSSNYLISFSNGTLTVNPKAQTITVSAPNVKTYGDADFSLGAAVSSGLALDYSSSDPTVATVDMAGLVRIIAAGTTTISVSQAGNSNYLASDVFSQVLTVNKANLAISADNKTKNYGDANPDLTLTYTGFVNGETSAVLSGLPNVTTTATTDADAGTYPIEVGDVAAVNYAITYVSGTLTINPNQQTVTVAAPSTKTYGDADFNLNASSSNSALPLTYTSSNPAVATVDASGNVHILAAGTVTISVSQDGNNNYVAANQTQTLTINKAALTVSADDKTRAYGVANPAFTLTYAGFVNGETASVFSTAPTVGSTAAMDSPAGNYPITITGGAADNYAFTYNTGTLTVAQPVISSVSLATATVFENQAAGTLAGTLSASSLDPNAVFTYAFLSGTGSADNNSFTILGNKILTAKSLNYEQQASYSILIRTTNQYGSYFDQAFTIQINDVNEAPTLAAVADQQVCYQPSTQNIALTGITPGPESAQTTTLSVSSTNPGLFKTLTISNVTNSTAALNYTLAGFGTATITVTVKDNGGTANGGTDSFSQTFTLTANDMPVAAVSSDKGTEVTKGQIVTLTATGGSSYNWGNVAGAIGATNTAVLQVRPAENTTYIVTATNASGCSTTASITINVADDYSSVQASNILTPNGDGKNDTWVVKNIDLYPESTIIIFDKGGRRLLNVKHYSNNWDGTFQGSPLTEGTYYYVIDFGQGKIPLKGFITLLRNR